MEIEIKHGKQRKWGMNLSVSAPDGGVCPTAGLLIRLVIIQ